MYKCSACGRFMKRIIDAVGMPLSTGFPPDNPHMASTVPYAPFVCSNHQESNIQFLLGRVEYRQVSFGLEN